MQTELPEFPEELAHSLYEQDLRTWIYYDGPALGAVQYKDAYYIFNATSEAENYGRLFVWLRTTEDIVEAVESGKIPLIEAYRSSDTILYREVLDDENEVYVEPISYDILDSSELPTVDAYVGKKNDH